MWGDFAPSVDFQIKPHHYCRFDRLAVPWRLDWGWRRRTVRGSLVADAPYAPSSTACAADERGKEIPEVKEGVDGPGIVGAATIGAILALGLVFRFNATSILTAAFIDSVCAIIHHVDCQKPVPTFQRAQSPALVPWIESPRELELVG